MNKLRRVVLFCVCLVVALLPILKALGVLSLEAAFFILFSLWVLSEYVLWREKR